MLAYLQHLSGYSRAQITRLVSRWTGGKRLLGKVQVPLTQTGEQRSFVLDGVAVVLRGWCKNSALLPGAVRIGFGECRGTALPALG